MPKSFVFSGFEPRPARSVDLNGSEYYRRTANNTLGIDTTFSISVWIKPTTLVQNMQMLHVDSTVGINEIGWRFIGSPGNDIEVTIVGDNGGITTKNVYNNDLDNNVWQHLVVTYDHSASHPGRLKVYKDSSLLVADTSSSGGGSTPVDSVRNIWWSGNSGIGFSLKGFSGPMAWWDTVLDSSNIGEIFNPTLFSQKPFDMDLSINQGNYDEAANLIHWWKQTVTEPGKTDHVGSLDMSNSVGITLADISTDVPA
jgi:hypothetical protein